MMLLIEITEGHGVDQDLVQVVDALPPGGFVECDRDAGPNRSELLNRARVLVSIFRFDAHTPYWNASGCPGIPESVKADPGCAR